MHPHATSEQFGGLLWEDMWQTLHNIVVHLTTTHAATEIQVDEVWKPQYPAHNSKYIQFTGQKASYNTNRCRIWANRCRNNHCWSWFTLCPTFIQSSAMFVQQAIKSGTLCVAFCFAS